MGKTEGKRVITKEAKIMNENNSNHEALIIKGILTSKNEISQDKINLISGATTAPFLETVWAFSGYETGTMDRILDIFNHHYSEGRESEMLDILRILYGVVGMEFPEDVELLATHPGARQYFLFSFMLDMEDFMHDLINEAAGE